MVFNDPFSCFSGWRLFQGQSILDSVEPGKGTHSKFVAAGVLSADQPPRFSAVLEQLIDAFAERPVPLRDVLEVMQSRGYTVLLVLLSFPFCTPIPLPGFSAPFGLVIAIIGLRLALGQKPWLPARLLDTTLPAKFLPRVLTATRRLVRWLEVFLRPRRVEVLRWRPVRHGIGAMIFTCGVLLLLPLPIPFSNGLPAFTVLLLASATLEEDGHAAIAGAMMFVVTLAFFAVLFWGGAEAAGWLHDKFDTLLHRERQGDV